MIQDHNERIWDAIIIGAGIAGLTASIYLARAGKTVLVLDKALQAGGRGVSAILSGVRVNLGAHALYTSALPILEEVGVKPAGAAPKPPGLFVFQEADGSSKSVPLSQLLLGSFLAFREKAELLRFYSRLRKTDTSALHTVVLQDYLNAQISSPRVKSLVHALVRLSTYCDAPDLLSAGAAIEQLQHSRVLYVNGGWQTLVDKLTVQAQHAGVSIRTSTSVREIAGSYPSMAVTLKDSSRLLARCVLSTAGPADTLALLNPSLPPVESAAYRQLIPIYAACLDLVVSGMPQPRTTFVLGADFPWYYSNHSAAASFSGHPGHEVVHVMKYLKASQASDPKQDEAELEDFLDRIQPGWRKHVVQQRFLPHILVSHGMVTAAAGGLPCRPGPRVEGRPGLYVAGDWVGSAGMLLNASLMSAKEAAGSIIAVENNSKVGNPRGA